jgi:hypothetical protein
MAVVALLSGDELVAIEDGRERSPKHFSPGRVNTNSSKHRVNGSCSRQVPSG